MTRAVQVELLLEFTRLLKKYGRGSFVELADSLDSSERRMQLTSLLRIAAELAPARKRAANKESNARQNITKVPREDPERSLEAWSRLIMRDAQPTSSAEESRGSVAGRVTFDRHGRVIGTGGWIPASWKGSIPVVVEVREQDGEISSQTIVVEAQEFLARLARKAPLRDYPEVDSK